MPSKLRLLRLAPSGSGSAIQKKYGSLDVYRLDEIPGLSEFHARICPTGTFNGEKWLDDHFVLYEIQCRAGTHFWRMMKLFWRARRIIRKHRINVVHSNSPYLDGLVLWAAARLARVPFCVSIHADYAQREALQTEAIPRLFGSTAISRWAERRVYRCADAVLPIRNTLRPGLIAAGCQEEKIRLFPHGIDMNRVASASAEGLHEQFGLPKGTRMISSAGRLEAENYCDDIVAIASACVQASPDVYAVLCGDGSQLERLRQEVEEAGLSDRIRLPGAVPHETVLALRKASGVNLCLMGGFSLIEACAAGRPVIAYNVEWHEEMVIDGQTGYLVPENDVEWAVDRCETLLANRDQADAMGAAARELAHDKFSLEAAARVKAEVYKELLGG